jgi:hypothetical protein
MKVIELRATMASAGPIGPFERAICRDTRPKMLIELPMKPTMNISVYKLLFLIQIGIEIAKIMTFMEPKVRYVTLDGSKPIFSEVICFVKRLFHVTIKGKANANEIGIQAGIRFLSSCFLIGSLEFR